MEKYFEIGRGYEQKSKSYKCPFMIYVDITESEKPYLVAMGAHHSDMGSMQISENELVSGRWDKHIEKSNCQSFIKKLKAALERQESFPQTFILDLVNK